MTSLAIESKSDTFSLSRLWLLVRMQVLSSYRSWLTGCAALAGIILIASMLADHEDTNFYAAALDNVVIFIGIFITSRSFQELHDKTKNELFLLIPASSLEKTLARLLVVTVGFLISAFVFIFIVSVLCELIKPLLYGPRLPVFNPFTNQIPNLIAIYLFLQSFYFLGAAWFKKNHLVKTILTQFAIVLSLALFSLLVIRIVFASYINVELDFNIDTAQLFAQLSGPVEIIVKLFMVLLTFACWAIAWMKVRETEVNEGV